MRAARNRGRPDRLEYTRRVDPDPVMTIPTPRVDGAWHWWSIPSLLPLGAQACLEPSAAATVWKGGRGDVWMTSLVGRSAVLRRYRRGGMPARFSRDTYLYTGLERSRPWREWLVTSQLWEQGLPVPEPLAAGLCRYGPGYQAAIVTARLPDAESLLQCLSSDAGVDWEVLATLIARFHAAGLDHVDLNVNNILLSGGTWHLIDFDQCRLRNPEHGWRLRNITRLKRSLVKQGVFESASWREFEDSYSSLMASR